MPGSVYGWGLNNGGQLGNGTLTNSNVPVQVKGVGAVGFLSHIKAISASWHSLALASDGKVFAWGQNESGQIGDGTNTDRTTPVQVKAVGGVGVLSDIKAISAGRITIDYKSHSLALGADGKVFAWGFNGSGQLGNGSNISSSTPVQVKGVNAVGLLSGIFDVRGGTESSLALACDSKVYSWGWNNDGQLGDGTNTNRTTPVQVKGVNGAGLLSNIIAISANTHSLALRSDGYLFSWGNNDMGQLGITATFPAQPRFRSQVSTTSWQFRRATSTAWLCGLTV
jgi:alpha-tubulin suppressor-like RCC1 family protein